MYMYMIIIKDISLEPQQNNSNKNVFHLSLHIRKPTTCLGENKVVDQPHCFRYTLSTIPLFLTPVSMTVQVSLYRTDLIFSCKCSFVYYSKFQTIGIGRNPHLRSRKVSVEGLTSTTQKAKLLDMVSNVGLVCEVWLHNIYHVCSNKPIVRLTY